MRTNQMICQCKITSFPGAEIAGMTKFHLWRLGMGE